MFCSLGSQRIGLKSLKSSCSHWLFAKTDETWQRAQLGNVNMANLFKEASTERDQSRQVLWQRRLTLGYGRWQLFKRLAAAVVVVSIVSLAR
jgi:hypothetical protein